MIAFRRWQQVGSLERYNPFQRIRVVPAYGTPEGAHGAFFWDPVSTDGIAQLAAADSENLLMRTLGAFVLVGALAGVAVGGHWAWKRAR